MRVSRNLIEDRDYFLRKLTIEESEGWSIIAILERELETHSILSNEMRAFITNALGNPEWERLVRARWLKKR
jgi:hypothetical protein